MIRFACPKCQQVNQRADQDAGQTVSCASCEQKLRVPSKTVQSKPLQSKVTEDSLDELEEVPEEEEGSEGASLGKTRTNVRDRNAEDRDEEIADRPRKKRGKPSEVLGPRKATFQPRKELLQLLLVVFGITGIGGLLCFALAMVGVLVDGGVALALFMIPTGVGGFLWCLNILSLKVVLHERGIVHIHRAKRRVIPWGEIYSVKQAITEVYQEDAYMTTTYHYTLELQDRTRIVYTNYRLQRVEKLGAEIMEQTSELIFPQALLEYKKGKVVDFGPLGVSQDGLHYGSSLLDWDDIKGVRIKEGFISVSKRGKWFKWCNIAASSIPNLHVFLALVDKIIGVDGA